MMCDSYDRPALHCVFPLRQLAERFPAAQVTGITLSPKQVCLFPRIFLCLQVFTSFFCSQCLLIFTQQMQSGGHANPQFQLTSWAIPCTAMHFMRAHCRWRGAPSW